jgi:ATP-dependent DNA helicase RecQ
MALSSVDLHAVLREQFGYEAFRPGQERIVRDLLAGRDVLAVLPTGAGKSLVFQLAAQLLPGATVVISPLIALMKDQAQAIEAYGLEVGTINSTQSASRSGDEFEQVKRGEAKLLYVTPERFENERFMAKIRDIRVSLLVVDEAHCVSEWGYDFRPSYLALAEVVRRLGRPALLALTATATPWVRRDVVERLGLQDPDVVVHGVDRPNLFFEARHVEKDGEDYRVLRSLLKEETADYPPEIARQLWELMQGSGIIYTGTTRAAAETVEWLREWGIEADFYHGQRKKSDRDRVQEAFMANEVRVIVATNAFGLGVDKPDVRFVIHRDVPASVEAYYQEAGRAGRDGDPARCTLIYRRADLGRAAFLSGGGHLSREEVEKARKALLEVRETSMPQLAEATGLSKGKLRRLIALLQQAGILEEKRGQVRLTVEDFNPRRISLETEVSRKSYERSRLDMVRGYAELWECRRQYLLNYFGQEMEDERCGWCDNDLRKDRKYPEQVGEDAGLPFGKGDRVTHAAWGAGVVLEVDEECITVRFEAEGEKKLAVDLVRERGLLQVIDEAGGEVSDGLSGDAVGEDPSFTMGEHVVHDTYGKGEVQRVTDETVTVLFEKVGYRTLETEVVQDRGLLSSTDEAADTNRTVG